MNRQRSLERISERGKVWDMIIIGGGASGSGVAVEAASRGYETLLLEAYDFAKGTSSRSTKLVHGGVRYLQQGNLSLVFEALKERGILRRNAPHLVHDLAFIVPSYDWWEGPFYGIGLKVYDMMSGKEGFGHSRLLSREETIEYLPNIESEGLNGGVIYYDGQFDDARLVINLLQTATEQGATVINYMPVVALHKKQGLVSGVVAVDRESGAEYDLYARTIINATGPFSDQIRRLDDADARPIITPSSGVHLVLDKSFLPGDKAIMVPHTDDGRILFAIPWHNRVLIGTTDTPIEEVPVEPQATAEEVEFLLKHAARYLKKDPTRDDVKSVFSGIRPLVTPPDKADTAAISREHIVYVSPGGLLTLAGGKWTTYRKMAEDTVEQAILLGGLEAQPSVTTAMNIHGYHPHSGQFGSLADYGSDALEIQTLEKDLPSATEEILTEPRVLQAEIHWAVQHEMARTVEDFLARRRRVLLLDAVGSVEIAPKVAAIMAPLLGHDARWQKEQVAAYKRLASTYHL